VANVSLPTSSEPTYPPQSIHAAERRNVWPKIFPKPQLTSNLNSLALALAQIEAAELPTLPLLFENRSLESDIKVRGTCEELHRLFCFFSRLIIFKNFAASDMLVSSLV
jgi:hypothetical protein